MGKYAQVVKRWLYDGRNINELNEWRNSPMHRAIRDGDVAVIQKLLEAGLALNVPNYHGETAKELVVASNDPRVCQTFDLYNVDLSKEVLAFEVKEGINVTRIEYENKHGE